MGAGILDAKEGREEGGEEGEDEVEWFIEAKLAGPSTIGKDNDTCEDLFLTSERALRRAYER
jgi:hypothetical protein